MGQRSTHLGRAFKSPDSGFCCPFLQPTRSVSQRFILRSAGPCYPTPITTLIPPHSQTNYFRKIPNSSSCFWVPALPNQPACTGPVSQTEACAHHTLTRAPLVAPDCPRPDPGTQDSAFLLVTPLTVISLKVVLLQGPLDFLAIAERRSRGRS